MNRELPPTHPLVRKRKGVTNAMEDWRKVLAQSITKPKDLAKQLGVDEKEVEDIIGLYPMRITPTVLATPMRWIVRFAKTFGV